MILKDHYVTETGTNKSAIVRDVLIFIAVLIGLIICWPFYAVPTGSRGVVTQFGKIIGIEVEKIKAEKWNGALPTAIYAGAPIPFLNVGK